MIMMTVIETADIAGERIRSQETFQKIVQGHVHTHAHVLAPEMRRGNSFL